MIYLFNFERTKTWISYSSILSAPVTRTLEKGDFTQYLDSRAQKVSTNDAHNASEIMIRQYPSEN